EETTTRIVARLKSSQLVVEVAAEKTTGLLLARPAERIRLDDVLEPFRPADVRGGASTPRLDAFLRELESARRDKAAELPVAVVLPEPPAAPGERSASAVPG